MASNRDPRPSYRRRNRAKPTSSATRSKRTKASTAPKPTSSSTRSTTKGRAKNRVTSDSNRVKTNKVSGPSRGAQGPRSAPVQGPRQKVSGLIGSRPKAKPTPPRAPGRNSIRRTSGLSTPKQVIKAKGKSGGGNVKGTLAAGLVTAAATGALRNPVSRAKGKAAAARGRKNAGNYNTRDADGTVRSRKRVGPKKVGPKKVGAAKVGSISQAFDKAYAAAKKQGSKTFMFKGKKYTTK
jgi:hypothetical protein